MSRRAPRPFSLALDAFARDLAPPTVLARVQGVWEGAAGAAVASACRPMGEREGVLSVTCSESVWAHELELMGEELVRRLNLALGEPLVKKLRCRTG